MLTGVINIDKPKGFTSHQVVSRLRKLLNIKQVGHTGTLDPLATGVLPICVGKATKIIEYLDTSKAYRAYIILGIETDTYDMEGQILEQKPATIDLTEIKKFLNDFKGEITQTPPIYSAIHHKGKRLYEYARKNIEVADIPTRKVLINSIELIETQETETKNPVIVVDIDCSGGTYIRSIAHDLGEKLGYGASLKDLTRTKSGSFLLEDSFTLEKIEEYCQKGEVEQFLLPPQNVLNFEAIEINQEQRDKIKNGQSIDDSKNRENGKFVQLICEDHLAAIAKVMENKIKPVKVFC